MSKVHSQSTDTIHCALGICVNPYHSSNIVSNHLLNDHICQCLEVLDKLLVLVIAFLLLDQQLEERGLLSAHTGHSGSLLRHV